MNKFRIYLVVGVLVLVPLINTGCTETSLRELVYLPVLRAAVDASVGGLLGILDGTISDALGDSPLMQAIGNALSTGAGDLVEYVVDDVLPGGE